MIRTLALGLLALTCSCQALRDYGIYRRVVAHEREYADVSIARYDLDVDLDPAQHRAHVRARPLFANHGDEPVRRVEVLLADGVELGPLRADGIELEHAAEPIALGGFRATVVEITGFPPIAPGGSLAIDFDYVLTAGPPNLALRLEPTDGFLLLESLWVPTLRTPLSEVGMERAPLAIEVSLPKPLVPLGLPAFELVSEHDRARTFRGSTEFRFSPFLVYGEYTEHGGGDGRVVTLAGSELPARATDFLAGALGELRERYERWFGAIDLPATRAVAVQRYGGSWGAPACLLIDDSGLPREDWREPSSYRLLAHELAHTWWGTAVALHGRTGYLHEGLANWCSASSAGERYGAEAEERAYEGWLVRYARGAKPLGKPLGSISILDGEAWERGAYLVGAHFYRALEREIGRERFLDALRRLFAEHAFESADFDDLRAVLGAGDPDLERFLDRWLESRRGGDELYRTGRELVETRTQAWREVEPAPSAELRADVGERLERAVASLEGADLASGTADERWARLAERIGSINDLPHVQITAIDAQADVAYHAAGVHGNVLGHRDVRGRSVYGTVVASDAGELVSIDFLTDDLRAGRENSVAWQRVGDLWLVVEGHEWRALDPLP